MPGWARIVLDTNVVISGLLFPNSNLGSALLRAQRASTLVSDNTVIELLDVLARPRFDRYVERGLRQRLAAEYIHACESVTIASSIQACRDPRDDKFLELAVDGRADVLVTGDSDLLALNPFQAIAIVSPADYLQ